MQFINVVARSRTAVAAEALFLRKQLAYYKDHNLLLLAAHSNIGTRVALVTGAPRYGQTLR